MPLIKSKSKKAFSKNVEAEMEHGKPQNVALGIAYSVKRKSGKKKMAEGGNVTISASTEKRPSTQDEHGDSDQTRRNKNQKSPGMDSWVDNPTIKQAQKPSITKLSKPRMVESGVLRTRLHTQEEDLQSAMPPSSDKDQPDRIMDEDDATKRGSDSDMTKPHRTASAYTRSVEDDDTEDQAEDDMKKTQSYADGGKAGETMMAKGGNINDFESMHDAENDNQEDPAGLEDDDDQMRLPVDEYMSTNRMSPMLADGGEIGRSPDDSEEGGDWSRDNDYYDDEGHEDSIAATIMARRNRLHDEIDSGAHDLDESAMYAEGGEVDLSMNHEEEPNNEDQMSFQALKKENYNSSNLDTEQPRDSNLKGDEEESDSENKHDMVESIRRKMMAQRQFTKR